jgi:type IV fimbrial biogenesis protein FimT
MKFNSAAFTLIEILLVLTLLILIGSLAFPSFNALIGRSQHVIFSSQLFEAVQLTRNEAMRRGEPLTLCASDDGKNCVGEWRRGYIIRQGKKVLFTFKQTMPGQLHWRVFGTHQQALVFLPLGLPAAENGTFWYCEGGAHSPAWALVLNRAGRPRLIYSSVKDGALQSLKCV